MGWVKDAKAQQLGNEAQRAMAEGRTVFSPMLNTPWTSSGASGSVSGWAEMIESIEAIGWRLDHWTVAQDAKGKPQAYPLFRRR